MATPTAPLTWFARGGASALATVGTVVLALGLEHTVPAGWVWVGVAYLVLVSGLSWAGVVMMWLGARSGGERAVAALWTALVVLYHAILVQGPG